MSAQLNEIERNDRLIIHIIPSHGILFLALDRRIVGQGLINGTCQKRERKKGRRETAQFHSSCATHVLGYGTLFACGTKKKVTKIDECLAPPSTYLPHLSTMG